MRWNNRARPRATPDGRRIIWSCARVRKKQIVAACPLYLKTHSMGEFVFDHGWADAAERAGIRYFPKMLVGVPFTPHTGRRFLTAPGADRAGLIDLLGLALTSICEDNKLSACT